MADLLRISIEGTLPGGEKWSVNPVWGLADFGEPVSPDQVLTIATAINAVAVPAELKNMLVSSCSFSGTRVEARTRAGVLQAQAEVLRATPVAGTGVGNHPYQTSLVVSLRTAQVGGTGRGRLYFPAVGLGLLATTLRITGSAVPIILGDVKTYLSGIQAAIRVTIPQAYLAVWSRSSQALYAVNKIQAGDVTDVQRRRRDALVENYSSATYP